MDNPKVAIIILNWNGWKDTIECLESVYQINYSDYDIVLVDNNSTDESIKKIKSYADGKLEVESKFFNYNPNNKPIEISIFDEKPIPKTNKQTILIENKINYGFAEGNNIGINFALNYLKSDYILLLNNDTVVDKDFLKYLIDEGEKDEKIGLLGPKMYNYDYPNKIWCAGSKINWKFARGVHIGINEEDNGQYDKKIYVDYINGSAILIKKEVIKNIGLLDKQFFLYFEESDLAIRASKRGYKSLYVPYAKIWHKISKSGGGIKSEIGLYYITRNRWLFMKKWAQNGDFLIFVILQIFSAVFIPISMSIYYKNRNLFRVYYKGLWDGIISK